MDIDAVPSVSFRFTMFDITGQDISLLSDEDLRALIGLLCEAELRRHGLSPLAVTWGGHQNATDGGIDVRVAAETEVPATSAIPRSIVGYQVKAEDMQCGKVLAEMRPDDILRASIQELANLHGSYIIVSSKGSVSNTALRERKRAMKDAVADLPNPNDLHLDFYDRDRVATWVRDHHGITTWVRERIGRPITGWRPYEDWTSSREGVTDEYLVDDQLRIQGPHLKGDSLPALEGMERIRAVLSGEQGIVRPVGLSGIGKTRLAQALFDDRVGANGLAPDLAIYTNLSDDPSPQPIAVATELVAQHRRQVLVIDNCPPDLHRRLSEVCGKAESKVSLLTIEHDVRKDQPEGTDVYELQPSSDDLIEKLLLRRVEGLSQVNAASIAKFASGNARVALALAKTIESGESVASLTPSREKALRQTRTRRSRSSRQPLGRTFARSIATSWNCTGETSSRNEASGERSCLMRLPTAWQQWLLKTSFLRTSSNSSRSLHPDCCGRFLDGSDICTPPRRLRRSSVDGSRTTGCLGIWKRLMKIEKPCWPTWLRSTRLQRWMRLNARLRGDRLPENSWLAKNSARFSCRWPSTPSCSMVPWP